MAKQTVPKRGVTPPKGRPTPSRHAVPGTKRVFGPVAQWIAAAIFLLLLIVVMVILTDGGDFNPFNDGHTGAVLHPAVIGSLSHWM